MFFLLSLIITLLLFPLLQQLCKFDNFISLIVDVQTLSLDKAGSKVKLDTEPITTTRVHGHLIQDRKRQFSLCFLSDLVIPAWWNGLL